MSSFLLPCACGQRTEVSVAQAGQSVRCACGAQLEVPTLRGLRALAQADGPRGKTAALRAWNNRHRAAFVLLVISLVSLAVSGYLAARLPSPAVHRSLDDVSALMAKASPAEVREVYQNLRKGLPKTVNSPDSAEEQRKAMLWGIKVGLVIAAAGLVGSISVALQARKQAR